MPLSSTCQWSLARNSCPLLVRTYFIRKGVTLVYIIDEVDGGALGLFTVDFDGSNLGGIINSRILKVTDRLALFVLKGLEFYIDLDLVARCLLMGLLLAVSGPINSGTSVVLP